ncbi:MAG: hypothetical protein K0S74_1161 [Chlamydiales bacterium]|jgi:DUF917 family protein|nr:hypothetical protein [Chlamydiales bacterium]
MKTLQQTDISDMALGTGILGSGGGGDTKISEIMCKGALKQGNTIEIVSLSEIEGDSLVVTVGVMGAPSVLTEKLPTKKEGLDAIAKMEEILGQKIDYLVPFEIGGMNGLYAVYIASQAKRSIVDADCMGRAFPEIQMVTPSIYGKIKRCIAVLSNGKQCCSISANNLHDLELKAREKTVELGGIVTLAYLPMSGKDAKKCCVPTSLSTSSQIGRSLRTNKYDDITLAFNKALSTTQYGPARSLIKGKIIELNRSLKDGFNRGWIILEDSERVRRVRIEFQNENLRAIEIVGNSERIVAQVPEIITLIDNRVKVLACECLRPGIEATVMAIQVPENLRTEQALTFIGPEAFKLTPLASLSNV